MKHEHPCTCLFDLCHPDFPEFYNEAAMQIKKRFPLGDPTMKMLRVLDPQSSCSEFPSLVPLASRFPNVVAEAKLQQFDSEWRRLSLVCLPFDKTDMGQEEFWGSLDKVKNGLGTPQFPLLCRYMQALLVLPCSNADVERVFSSVNNIKTKQRNKLHSSTVSSLLKVKNGITEQPTGSCVSFKLNNSIRQRMQSSSNDYADTDSD